MTLETFSRGLPQQAGEDQQATQLFGVLGSRAVYDAHQR